MGYRTRPRFEAQIRSRSAQRDNTPAPSGTSSAPKPEGRWEPRQVLEALHEMHNAPAENSVYGRRGGI